MRKALYVPIDDATWARLEERARSNRRDPRDEAALVLEQAVARSRRSGAGRGEVALHRDALLSALERRLAAGTYEDTT